MVWGLIQVRVEQMRQQKSLLGKTGKQQSKEHDKPTQNRGDDPNTQARKVLQNRGNNFDELS